MSLLQARVTKSQLQYNIEINNNDVPSFIIHVFSSITLSLDWSCPVGVDFIETISDAEWNVDSNLAIEEGSGDTKWTPGTFLVTLGVKC